MIVKSKQITLQRLSAPRTSKSKQIEKNQGTRRDLVRLDARKRELELELDPVLKTLGEQIILITSFVVTGLTQKSFFLWTSNSDLCAGGCRIYICV